MRVCGAVLVVLGVVLLSSGGEGGRQARRRGRTARRHQQDGGWSHARGWRRLLDNLMGRIDSRRFGFELGSDESRFNFDFGWNFQRQPWWEGPHVCSTKTEETSNTTGSSKGSISRHFSLHSQVCDETATVYKCTTTSRVLNEERVMTEVKECCHGFTRKEDEYGCPREEKLENLVDTARKLGLTEFIRAADRRSLTEELKQGNFTVFAPINSAFKDLDSMLPEIKQIMPQDGVVMVSRRLTDQVLGDVQNLLLGHLVVGRFPTSRLTDEQLVQTGSPYKAKIRINFFEEPQKLTTANCVKVSSPDNQATNGVLHQVEALLHPVTSSLVDLISKSPQHGILKTALARADLVQTFREDGQWTFFAPTDAAFKQLERGLLDQLLEGDPHCLQKVLKNHVLPNVICSAVIQGKAKSRNLLHSYLNLSRNEDDKVFVQGAQLVGRDNMATNGVLHVIDKVLVPEEALRVTDLIDSQGATEFLRVLKKTKLLTELQKSSNITIFVPSNEALQNLDNETMKNLMEDDDLLADVIKYHVVPEKLSLSSMYSNQQLDTRLPGKQIRINEYSLFPYADKWSRTAMCAPIRKANTKSCNGMINIIDKVMIPPPGNVLDVLALYPRLSTLVKLLKEAGLADSLQEDGPFTIFAPTNQAFEAINEKTLTRLRQDPEQMRHVLKNHIANDALCCAGIFESGWYGSPRLRTLSGEVFRLDRRGDRVDIGPAFISRCDVTGNNGVVHVIDRVLMNEDEGEEDIWARLFGRRGRRNRGRGRGRLSIFDI